MARGRRKWTAEEDACLREAVQAAADGSHPFLWREIAKSVPGRSNKDCRRRWCNSLARGLSKGFWTESEDERLWNAVCKHGTKWAQVAHEVRTRNSDQCSSHWNQTLDPDINFSDWTRQEDQTLLQAIGQLGTNWTTIASKHLPSRTTLALKNRYNALRAKMACNGRPTPMDKAGTHQPAARHLTNSRNKSSNQLSSPPTVDGEDEEGQDDGDDDHEDDRNSGDDDDDDDDDEPKTSEEEDFTSATSPSNDLMEMQNLSPLRFPPASSMAPPECRLYPPYHLNAFQHSGLVSTPPFTTTSMALSGVPDLGSYHENTNLEGDGLSTSPPWTIQNTEYSLNGCHPFPLPDCQPARATLADYRPDQGTLAADTCSGLRGPSSQMHLNGTNTVATSVSSESLPSQGPVHVPRRISEAAATLSEQDRLPQPLQHVSINLACTSQQLSQIMGAVVGIASSVTLKIDNMNP